MAASPFDIVLRLTAAVATARTLPEIYDAALDGLRDAFGVERASILLFDPDRVMRFKAWRGLSPAYRAAVEGHTPWTLGQPAPEPVVVPDVRVDESLGAFRAVFDRERIVGLAFVPLVAESGVIGKFMLYTGMPASFTDDELNAARALGFLIGFSVERTERTMAAQRERQSLLFALDAAQMGTWDWNVLTNQLTWSENLERIHGLPSGTFGNTFDSYAGEIHREDRDRVIAALQRTLTEGAPHEIEYRIVAPDGAVRWVLGKGRVERNADGAPIRMSGVCMDVSARKRIEADQQALRRTAEAAQVRAAFLAEASAQLSSLDYERSLQTVARLAVPLLGDWCAVDMRDGPDRLNRLTIAHVDPAKVALAQEVHQRYPPDLSLPYGIGPVLRTGVPQLYAEISDEMLAATAVDDEQLAILRELGLRSAIIVPLPAAGEVFGVLTFVSSSASRRYDEADLQFATELGRRAALAIHNARLYKEAQEASRLKDEFLATVSHELRTPLNVIQGRTRMMLNASDLATARENGQIVARNAESLARLVEDLLDTSRMNVGQVALERQPVLLTPVIESSILAVQPAIAAKRIALSIDTQPDLPPFVGDPTRIQQVVWNLLMNAVKFTPRDGWIRIEARVMDGHISLSVSDSGQGIPPDALARVFDPFWQGEPTASRQYGGLGLGLSIVRRLVELHGGDVRAHSDGPGRGSTFTISLPCSPSASTAGS